MDLHQVDGVLLWLMSVTARANQALDHPARRPAQPAPHEGCSMAWMPADAISFRRQPDHPEQNVTASVMRSDAISRIIVCNVHAIRQPAGNVAIRRGHGQC
jgi:hypothetical protein